MKARLKSKLIFGTVIVALVGSLINGQQSGETKRKLKTKVDPPYPELALKMKISGKVKVEAVVAADGHVQSVRAVGGSPVLVQPCLDAVKEWRFAIAQEATTELIEFSFNR